MEYLAIDTESCTGKTNDGSLCSLGYVILDEKLNIIKKEDILFNPLPKRFFVGDKRNIKKTGVLFAYTPEEFRKAERFSEKYDVVKALFQGRTVLGFSMANDIRYVNDACEKFGLPVIEYEFIDIQYLYKLLYPAETSTGLKTLCEKYGNEYLAHRSDEDAAASVSVLKGFLQENGISLQALIEKYGVHFGKNDDSGYYMNFSDAAIENKYGLSVSSKIKSALYSEYIAALPIKKRVDRFAFSHKTERFDIDKLRTYIDLIYENGYAFTKDYYAARYLVIADEESEINFGKRLKKISVKEFEEKIGYNKPKKYDDKKFITEYYLTKQK